MFNLEKQPSQSETHDTHREHASERRESDALIDRFNALSKFHRELVEEHRDASGERAAAIERDMANVLNDMWQLIQLARGKKEVHPPKQEPEILADAVPREAEDTKAKVQRLRGEVRELIAQRQKYERAGDPEMAAEVEKQIAAKMDEFPTRE